MNQTEQFSQEIAPTVEAPVRQLTLDELMTVGGGAAEKEIS
jgi:hypothetical protein